MCRQMFAVLLIVFVCYPLHAEDAPKKSPITIAIAIPVHHGHRSLNEADHFHVTVTNTSEKSIRLWMDRFSWGNHNLSFQLIDDEGKVMTIKKKVRGWTKNYPDWLQLEPGESYVLNVDFFSETGKEIWENVPVASDVKPRIVKMKAIYETIADDESRKTDVWAGMIESAVGTYAIW